MITSTTYKVRKIISEIANTTYEVENRTKEIRKKGGQRHKSITNNSIFHILMKVNTSLLYFQSRLKEALKHLQNVRNE